MPTELDDLREHLERFRGVTLQHFDILSEQEMSWRPRPEAFTCGQQLLHIIQGEDFYVCGFSTDDWNLERLRLPKPMPSKQSLREQFDDVRRATLTFLSSLRDEDLSVMRRPGHVAIDASLRTWLWFILEHEIHHKAQLAEYLRGLGHVPPYFGIPLPLGTRPDVTARNELGGV